MKVECLRAITPRDQKFRVGAVAGNMLYLTSFTAPILGALWGIDLSNTDAGPKVRRHFVQAQGLG